MSEGDGVVGFRIKVPGNLALEETLERVEVPVLSEAFAALPGEGHVPFASLAQGSDFLAWGGFREEDLQEITGLISKIQKGRGGGALGILTHLGEIHTLWLHSPNRLCPSMQERLRHRRLIGTLHPPIKPKICRLERHLHKRIRTEPMARDKILPVAFELQRLAVVLAYQVTQTRLGEADAHTQLGCEGPFEFLGKGVDQRDRWAEFVFGCGRGGSGWLVGLGVWGEGRVEERGGGGVDGPREKHQAFREYVRCESEEVR